VTTQQKILCAALGLLISTSTLGAGPTIATPAIKMYSAKAPDKAGTSLPEMYVELSLPFYGSDGCKSTLFFPQVTLTRLNMEKGNAFPIPSLESKKVIEDSQTQVQKLFKKIPELEVIQETARAHLKKQTTPEWNEKSLKKVYKTLWDSVDVPSSTNSVIILNEKPVDDAAKTKFANRLLEKVKKDGKDSVPVATPADVKAARESIAKSLCAGKPQDGEIAIYLISELPPPESKHTGPPPPPRPTEDCSKIPFTDKKVCIKNVQPKK
jgi:hypothetical protein